MKKMNEINDESLVDFLRGSKTPQVVRNADAALLAAAAFVFITLFDDILLPLDVHFFRELLYDTSTSYCIEYYVFLSS